MTTVIGVDGCRGGWVAAVAETTTGPDALALLDLTVVPSLDAVIDLPAVAGRDVAVVGVDIPIGLPDRGHRAADLAARKALGRRWSSIFLTPTRAALAEPTREAADVVNREHDAGGVTAQSFGLFAKIAEADAWVPTAPVPIAEVHPELSFTHLLGAVPRHAKKTWAGMLERLDAVRSVGLDPASFTELDCAPDDALDAVVAAWSASRVAHGAAVGFPPKRHVDATGLPMQILA